MSDHSTITSLSIERLLDQANLLKNVKGHLTKNIISGMQTDSRFIEQDMLFICIPGA